MKNVVTWIFFSSLIVCFMACAEAKKVNENASIGDNSRNSLDWDGAYRGMLPCADCKGIQTTIHLNEDLTYRVKEKYVGKDKQVTEHSGKFNWNDEGNTITLDEASGANMPAKYFVGENTLTQLDVNGDKNTGEHAADYVLSKANFDILEKYWKLTELYGKPVAVDSSSGKEPYIILKEADDRVNGNGGCNTLAGNFEVRSINRISFAQVISTRMACPAMQLESEFLKALTAADSFNLVGDTLILNKARMAPLARFTAVYMK